jgi:phosphatidylglycerol lysyltransferase
MSGTNEAGISFRSTIACGWPVWLVSISAFLNGLLNILLALLVQVPSSPKIGQLTPFGLYRFSIWLTVAIGFLLVYLSLNLLQRRRAAWWLATIGSGINILIDFADSQFWPAAVVPVITFSLLLGFRRRFTVRSERRNIIRGLLMMAFALLFAITYGTISFLLLSPGDFGVSFTPVQALIRTLREFVLIGNNDLVPQTGYALWFIVSIRIVGILALVFAFYSVFRPVAYRFSFLPYQNTAAGTIRDRYARFSYDYFKVWPDKSYFFSASGRAFIAYRVEWNVAVCLGDPVGPENEIEETIRQFIRYCRDNGWSTALMFPELLSIYRKVGLHLLKIGEEGIVDLEHFKTETYHKKYFRHIRNRFGKLGYSFSRYKPQQENRLLDEIELISRQWMKLPGHHEFGFVQGIFDRNYLRKMAISVMRNSEGQAVAFVNEVPSYRPGEINFDLMRHIPGVPNGTMDYIFMNLMLALREEGYRKFAMGVAPFAGIGKGPGSSLTEKAMHQLQHFDWLAHSRGIFQYKLKFEPLWEDRYVAYQGGPLSLVKVALAITRAVDRASQVRA